MTFGDTVRLKKDHKIVYIVLSDPQKYTWDNNCKLIEFDTPNIKVIHQNGTEPIYVPVSDVEKVEDWKYRIVRLSSILQKEHNLPEIIFEGEDEKNIR